MCLRCRLSGAEKRLAEQEQLLRKREARIKQLQAGAELMPPLQVKVATVQKLTQELEDSNTRLDELMAQRQQHAKQQGAQVLPLECFGCTLCEFCCA